MTFEMNNHKWQIKEIAKYEIIDFYKNITKEEDIETIYGISDFENKIVYINISINLDKKKQTLKHELMHVYIDEYCLPKNEYSEEELCNFSANSHDIIHEIVESYFKKAERNKNE